MVFLEPNETAWDLRWRMFGIPVRVHPMFWLITAVMGGDSLKLGVEYLLAWIACVFVSILVHELGHVVMGLAFGTRGYVVLYSFGGLAVGSNALGRRWQRIAVSFAGPLAGFLLLGGLLGCLWLRDPDTFPAYLLIVQLNLGLPPEQAPELAVQLVRVLGHGQFELAVVNDLIFINLLWGLVNLLPIWPLDGGKISRELCEGVSPRHGLAFSLGLSFLVCGLIVVNCVLALNGRAFLPVPVDSLYPAILFGLLALQSFQLLQQVQAQRQEPESWVDDHREN